VDLNRGTSLSWKMHDLDPESIAERILGFRTRMSCEQRRPPRKSPTCGYLFWKFRFHPNTAIYYEPAIPIAA